jgi:phosphohistidine phosphatase
VATLETYLIRHGIAADSSSDGSDHARPLTSEGIASLRAEAAGLERLKVRFDVIWASPLLRARQTAEVLAAALGTKAPVIISAALATTGSPDAVTAEMRKRATAGHIALVGHEPGMGELAASWLGTRHPVPFKKGAICRIDFQAPFAAGGGELRWFLTPKVLNLAGRAGG